MLGRLGKEHLSCGVVEEVSMVWYTNSMNKTMVFSEGSRGYLFSCVARGGNLRGHNPAIISMSDSYRNLWVPIRY